jgi:hypothetical protein
MVLSLSALLIVISLAYGSPRVLADDCVKIYNGVSADELFDIMMAENYKVKKGDNPDTIIWDLSPRVALGSLKEKGHIYILSEFPDYKISQEKVYILNRLFPLHKVFLENGTLKLETFLDLKGGVTLERIKNHLKSYKDTHNTINSTRDLAGSGIK